MHKLFFLVFICNVVTILSMDPIQQLHDFKKMVQQSRDTPALPFNPIDGVMIVDVVKQNNLILLEDMLAAFGPQSCGKGLHTAAAYGRVDCMKFFLKYGADLNETTEKGNTPLHYAKTVKAADYLLENDAFVDAKNKKGKTPLYTALFSRHERSRVYPYKSQGLYIAQLLIDHDADINAVDKDGDTLLHTAIEKRNLAAAEFLLS